MKVEIDVEQFARELHPGVESPLLDGENTCKM